MKPEFKVGDAVLMNWGSPYTAIINWYQRRKLGESKFSHIGAISSIVGDTVFIHEAIFKMRDKDIRPYAYSKKGLREHKKAGRIMIRRPKIKLLNFKKNCEKYEGSYYDWVSIFLMIFKITINSVKGVFCSEFKARVDYDSSNKKLNIAKEFGVHWEKVLPMHYYYSKQYVTIE